jgi:dipeptide/tripeptide permease
MTSGFIITLIGVIMMLIVRRNVWGEHTESIAMTIAIAGFVVYVCGRILFTSQQRKNRKSSSTPLSSKE